jgi:hypothetical protein
LTEEIAQDIVGRSMPIAHHSLACALATAGTLETPVCGG